MEIPSREERTGERPSEGEVGVDVFVEVVQVLVE